MSCERPQFATVVRNEDVTLVFDLATDDTSVTDVSLWALEFGMTNAAGDTVLLTKTSADNQIFVNENLTSIEVDILSLDTTLITPGRYPFDIWRTDFGMSSRLAFGFIRLQERRATIPPA